MTATRHFVATKIREPPPPCATKTGWEIQVPKVRNALAIATRMLAISENLALAAAKRAHRSVVTPHAHVKAFHVAGSRSSKRGIRTSRSPLAVDPNIVVAGGAALAATGAAAGFWVISRVHIAKPNQYIIKTGVGISDVVISKNTVQWPFQKVCI